MRAPDRTKTVRFLRHNVEVNTWIDQTDLPWGGCEPLPENCEGFDVLVKVALKKDNQFFTASDSLCSIWITPDNEGQRYLESTIDEVLGQALDNLKDEVKQVARGTEAKRALIRQTLAQKIAR